MKQKLFVFMSVCILISQTLMYSSDSDFDDTPVLILFTSSPAELASINPLDKEMYRLLMNELEVLQRRVHDQLISLTELPFILKKLQTKSKMTLADKESQEKFNVYLRHVAGYYRTEFA